MFSFLTDKELARYLEDAFKNDIAKDAFKRLDSRNLTDEYLDKTNSGELEDPMNYKSSGLVYTNRDKDSYKVFVLMPGVSKDDITIINRGTSKNSREEAIAKIPANALPYGKITRYGRCFVRPI